MATRTTSHPPPRARRLRRVSGSRRPAALAALRLLAQSTWLAIALVALWWITSADGTSLYYPPLADILEVLRQQFLSGQVSETLLPSLGNLALSFALAVALAVPIGYGIGRARFAREAITPILDLCRSTPVIALIPASVAVLGIGTTSEVALVAWACAWPILLSTIDGVARVERGHRDSARSLRLSRWQALRLVDLPAAAPQILAGINTAIAIGITAMVAVEMFTASSGMGQYLIDAQRNFDIPGSYAGAVAAGIVGYLLGAALVILERRWVLRWHFDMRRTSSERA